MSSPFVLLFLQMQESKTPRIENKSERERKMQTKYLRNLAGALALATLAACGGSGSCPPNGSGGNSGELTLKLTAPNQYPAEQPFAVTAYLTMTNTSNVNATNLSYDVPNASNYTGVAITVQNGVTNNPCTNILAGASCTFPAVIAANAHPGSFTVTATPNGSASQSTVKKLWNSLKSDMGLQAGTLSLTANIGLTSLPANSNSGANGISFLYSNTIAANESGDTLLSVVGVVNSASAGNFNTINLTDQSGNPLNFTVLSGNSGQGSTNLARGSIVTFLLKIPASAVGSTFNFYAQTVDNNGGGSSDQGTIANPVTVGTAAAGVLVIQPTNFSLTAPAYESQIITFTNIGNGAISSLNIPTPDSPLYMISNNCASTLTAGAICTYRLGSHAEAGFSGDAGFSASYNNGTTTNSVAAQVHYSGLDPVAGISVTSGDNPSLNFVASTEISSKSSQLTLANTGNVSESNFVFTVPNYFTLTAGTTGTACSLSGNTVTSVLAKDTSCTLTLTYSNGTITAQQIASLLVYYKYHGIDAPQTSKVLTYETVLASGIIQVTPLSYTYPNIRANGSMSESQVFVYTNIGTGTATNVTADLPNPEVFSIVPSVPSAANDCGSSITSLAPSATCQVTVQFGSTTTTQASYNKQLQVSYESMPSTTPVSANANISGTVLAPLAANIIVSNVSFSPEVLGGNGESVGTAFAFESTTPTVTITLTYKNVGNDVAKGFTLDASNPSIGTTQTNNCNGGDLAIDGTCSVVINYITTVGGAGVFLGAKHMPLAWSDDAGSSTNMGAQWDNNGTMQDTVYLEVFTARWVSAVMSHESDGSNPISSLKAESDFYVVYTLHDGYNVGDMLYGINLGSAQGGTPPMAAVSFPANCTVSGVSQISSCAIKINAGGEATNQSIVYRAMGGATTPTPTSSGNFDVTPAQTPMPFSGPAFIAINSAGTYAYVTNKISSNVSKCKISPTTGDLTICVDSGATGFTQPMGIAISGNYAYVSEFVGNKVYKCTIDATSGNFTSCVDSGALGLMNPVGIAFQNSTTAYIANNGVSLQATSKCDINAITGQLENCVPGASLVGVSKAFGIAIGGSAYSGYFVVNNLLSGSVSACGFGSSIACSAAYVPGGTDFVNPIDIAIYGDKAYVTSSNGIANTITTCTISGGVFGPCSVNNIVELSNPYGIAVNSAGTYAYVANYDSNTVRKCPIDAVTGDITTCQ